MSRVGEVLERAADRVAKLGFWKRGDPEGEDKICAGLAIMSEGNRYGLAAVNAFAAHLGITPSLASIYVWNDAPERTQQGVVQALRDAAAALARESAS